MIESTPRAKVKSILNLTLSIANLRILHSGLNLMLIFYFEQSKKIYVV